MKVVLKTQTQEEKTLDLSAKTPAPELDGEVPCFQCGVCCVRWQPLMDKEETERIAGELGISGRAFRRKYTRPYPPRPGWRIMRANEKGCVFLRYEGRKALCSIHPFKPEACISWTASLGKKECRDGFEKLAQGKLSTLEQLYDSPEDREAFTRALKGPR